MQRLIVSLLLIFTSVLVQAQPFSLKGKINDPENAGLPNATVLLLNPVDSTMVNYGLSNLSGSFEIRNLARREYLMRITYIGFGTHFENIVPPEGNLLDLGTIRLENERVTLIEVMVQEERIPMRVRNDTIEYDALAFKPLPNEVVEDLLKRLPGIEVQSDGGVVAQGETVRRVLVDGKEFFGRDPKMATQNLPADAVSKVHVFDQRSEQALFTGIDDGERERTINLELKEDRKEGLFGNTSLAYGTDERFQGKTNINRFDNKGQLSILGMGNNVNQTGFSMGEYLNFSGGAQSLLGGGGGGAMQITMNSASIPISFDGRPATNGLMTSWAGGANVNRKLGEKTEVTASYFYNQLGHDVSQSLERENFLPSGNFFFDQQSLQDNRNFNHRLNLRLDHKFSEASSLLFTANTSANKTESNLQSFSTTLNADGFMQNSSQQATDSEGQRLSLETSLLWRQRLNKPGRTLTAGLNFSSLGNDQDANLEALNRFFGNNPYDQPLLQYSTLGNLNNSMGVNANYTEPLGNRRFLEANYRITRNFNEVDQQVFDIEDALQTENELLTNKYNNTYLFQRAGLNLNQNRDRYNLTIGTNLQVTSLRGNIITSNQEINKDYTHVLPVLRFNYEFSNFRRLMANYETNVQEPSILQLQPLIDNRDPLNLYVGNPELKPSYRHRATLRFNTFNPLTSFGFFTFFTADYVKNAITNATSVDEQLVRTITPVNVKDNMSLRANVNVNMGLSKIKSRFQVGSTITHSQSVNILNGLEQDIANNILGGNARFTFRPGDSFEASLTANVNQQLTKYEFSALEQAFLNQTYGSEVSWTFLKDWRLGTGYRYQIYEGRTEAFDRKIPMLDFSLSRTFLKGNAGELKLSGYNLLNKDLGVTQSADINYIQRLETNSLGRYFLLSFTYSLNRALNVFDNTHRPGSGGGMRIMH
ncbi:MAG: TonB-dependent receptor [Bacteroidales bacterium]|nr:TonB-dependent receptor [Bacteroidales bacterium]